MFSQSCYVLYLRSKTKKFYQIGLNNVGLIQLDRANHCGLCYFFYSLTAIADVICEDLEQAGDLDQAWPNFLLAIKCTLTLLSASVILWLCISHVALTKYANITPDEVRSIIPTTVIPAMNGFLVVMLTVPAVPICITFYRLTMQYIQLRDALTPTVLILRNTSCSGTKCSLDKMLPMLLPLKDALVHMDLMEYYFQTGHLYYLAFSCFILLLYPPFMVLTYQSFVRSGVLDATLRKKQKEVLINTFLEFSIMTFLVIMTSYQLIVGGLQTFIYNRQYWLIIRIGLNSVISILGNFAIFLILHSLLSTDTTPSYPQSAIVLSNCKTKLGE